MRAVVAVHLAMLVASSPSASPSARSEPGFGEALGTGGGIVVLLVIVVAFLWLRSRAMRRR